MAVRAGQLLDPHNHAQRERLAFIDFSLEYKGTVGRNELMEQFGIAVASSTRDFALYRELAPDNLVLRQPSRRYHRTESFRPLFQHDSDTALRNLTAGFACGLDAALPVHGFEEASPPLIAPTKEILAALSRAIHLGLAVRISYTSLSSGRHERSLVPHSIVHNGQRWHVRGYCRKRGQFRDFVCTRITAIKVDSQPVADYEQQGADVEWNQWLTLELVPHPGHGHPQAIALDYAMTESATGPAREVKIRAARAGYLLNYWKVDCTPAHELPPEQHHLWLRNCASIAGMDHALLNNMTLAPGFPKGMSNSAIANPDTSLVDTP